MNTNSVNLYYYFSIFRPTYPRNWHHTGLGTKIANNEYKMRSRDTILTVMSYNILADYLAQRHPELYNQGIYLKKNSRNFLKVIFSIKFQLELTGFI